MMRPRIWLLPVFLLAIAPLHADDDDFQKRVDAAIHKGSSYLRRQYTTINGMTKISTGYSLLALYAIVHAARPEDKEFIRDCLLQKISTTPAFPTYENGILALTLAINDGKVYRNELAALENKLWTTRSRYGGWGYGNSGDTEGTISYDNLSTSQFALLGLHTCRRAEMAASKSTSVSNGDQKRWEHPARYWLSAQNDDGGWPYLCKEARSTQQIMPPKGANIYRESYLTMTCAGISSLAVCRIYAKTPSLLKKIDDSLDKGRRWLDQWVAKSGEIRIYERDGFYPLAMSNIVNSAEAAPDGYALYSLEKACDLAGIPLINGKDWYRENAEWLIKIQHDDGKWFVNVPKAKDSNGMTTAFAILFLKRANRVIFTGDKPGNWAGPLQRNAPGTFMGDDKDKPIETGKKE